MRVIGIFILAITLAIAIPTKDTWSYKVMYDRHHTIQDDNVNKDATPIRGRKR